MGSTALILRVLVGLAFLGAVFSKPSKQVKKNNYFTVRIGPYVCMSVCYLLI